MKVDQPGKMISLSKFIIILFVILSLISLIIPHSFASPISSAHNQKEHQPLQERKRSYPGDPRHNTQGHTATKCPGICKKRDRHGYCRTDVKCLESYGQR